VNRVRWASRAEPNPDHAAWPPEKAAYLSRRRDMNLRARLTRLEDWAERVALQDDKGNQREALQQRLDAMPLEVLLLLYEAMKKHSKESGDLDAYPLDELDLSEQLRPQVNAYLTGGQTPAG
jgi:hypothetical protein